MIMTMMIILKSMIFKKEYIVFDKETNEIVDFISLTDNDATVFELINPGFYIVRKND